MGGLAVALGIGMALAATPGTAWANHSTSAAAETKDGSGPAGPSESAAPKKTEGTTDSSFAEPSDKDGDSAKTTDPERVGPADAESSPDDRMESDPAKDDERPKNRQRGTRRATLSVADREAGEVKAPPRRIPSLRDRAVVEAAVAQSSAPPATMVVMPTAAPTRAGVVAHQGIPVGAPDAEPSQPATLKMTMNLPTPTALGSSSSDGPAPIPVDSQLETALAAWAGRPRLSGVAPSSRSTETGQTFATALALPNSAPDVRPQPVGIPDPVTGLVTGTVIATDPDHNTLTYAVAREANGGSVVVNPQTGRYTYTPTEAARLAAGTTTTADIDCFTVSVGDGQQTSIATIQVYISPTRLDTKASIAVGSRPSAMVMTSDGRMFVANTGSNTVSVINTVTGQRIDANTSVFSRDISVGSAPSALGLSTDGKRMYVANTRSGSVTVIDTATYKRVDANTSIFSTSIAVGSSPAAMALSGTRLYVANRGSNTVSVIDTTINKMVDINANVSGNQSISVGSGPTALELSGNRLYVANRSSNTVSVIDTSTNTVIKTIAVASQPSDLAIGSNDRLYVVGNGTVSIINTGTDELASVDPKGSGTNPIPVGLSPSSVAVSPLGNLAYVANGDDSISVIDTEAFTVLRTVAIDSDPTGGHIVTISPTGTLYVSDAVDNTVRVLAITPGSTPPPDATKLAVIGNISLPGYRWGPPVLSADGSRGVITGSDGGNGVVVIDLASGTQISNIQSGSPSSTDASHSSTDGTHTLVYNIVGTPSTGFTTQVTVVDVTTGAQIGSTFELAGDGSLYGPELNWDGSRALITTRDWDPDTNFITIRAAVMNTDTGDQLGDTVIPVGEPYPMLSADRTRALIFDSVSDPTLGSVTHITAIDLDTGTHTTTTRTGAWRVPLIGTDYSPQLLDDEGSRALMVSDVPDPRNLGNPTTLVAVINTITGAQIGTTLTLHGSEWGSRLVSLDRSRALIVTNTFDGRLGINTTRLSLVDTANATQVATTTTMTGFLDGGSIWFSADLSRAVTLTLSTNVASTGTPTVQVSVVDTDTGNQVGADLTLDDNYGSVVLSADGTRALVSTGTKLAVINTATGALAGPILKGTWGISNVLSPDGRRAVTADVVFNRFTGYSTKVSVVQIG
ncbi:YncE family protein [Mycolicibacterium psychrotolerans]|uniref:YncE family protein n=1 Tax=Mycolicibacterium psychrotolerans TaxID=216929 RepID=UPI0013D71630|nr:YncE family protein [Mycolicibacterium psychrotolerans]